MQDADTVNEILAEQRQYEAWQTKEKNRILAMSNVEKKQAAWRSLFPKWVSDDSYLAGGIY